MLSATVSFHGSSPGAEYCCPPHLEKPVKLRSWPEVTELCSHVTGLILATEEDCCTVFSKHGEHSVLFSTAVLMTFWAPSSLSWVLSCTMFSSFPGLYPLDASGTPQLIIKIIFKHCLFSPRDWGKDGTKLSPC